MLGAIFSRQASTALEVMRKMEGASDRLEVAWGQARRALDLAILLDRESDIGFAATATIEVGVEGGYQVEDFTDALGYLSAETIQSIPRPFCRLLHQRLTKLTQQFPESAALVGPILKNLQSEL